MDKPWLKPIAQVLMLVLLCSLVYVDNLSAAPPGQPTDVAPAFADVSDDYWGKTAIDKWSRSGVIRGDGYHFYPDRQISRAEMAAVLGKVFGYSQTRENPFADVEQDDWYYDTVIKAYASGVMLGSIDADNKRLVRPNDPLTRAEAAVLFQRIFSVTGNAGLDSSFKDSALPAWAREAIFGMEAAGYMQGKGDGWFDPNGHLTRAEAVQMLNNIVSLYICQPGTYSTDSNQNVVVNTPNAVLQNMQINGNLYLAEGIGEGAVRLANIKVAGTTYVRGGAADKITIENCDFGKLVTVKAGLDADKLMQNQTGLGSGTAANQKGAGGSSSGGSTGGSSGGSPEVSTPPSVDPGPNNSPADSGDMFDY